MMPRNNKIEVIFFEAGRSGGSVNRLIELLHTWDFNKIQVGLFTFYFTNKAAELHDNANISFNGTFGLKNESLPDPFVNIYGILCPTIFGIKYFIKSLSILLWNRNATVYINNTPYSHIPLILAAILLDRNIICHLRDTIKFTKSEKYLIKYVSKFVVLSNAGKQHYIRQGILADKIEVIYDSINFTKINLHNRRVANSGKISAVVVGSLVSRKRQDICIKAFERVIERCKNAELLIVGDGDQRQELVRLANELSITTNIHFLGNVDNVGLILSQCHIGILVSCREGMPNSVMEYMAASLPVIVSNLPGISELVEDGKSGFVVPIDSVDELTDKWIQLCNDGELRGSMGTYGYEFIKSPMFSQKSEMEGIISIISSINTLNSRP